MAEELADPVWEAFVVAMLAAGPARERPSRYGGKPALCTDKREIAHLEASGVIDLRITQAGWSLLKAEFGQDQAVRHDRSRRDWIELHLSSADDLPRLERLLVAAMNANT